MADAMISRSALERVLARASQLQAEGDGDSGDAISETRLLEIAGDVGLDVQHVRQAIAEERARLPMSPAERGPLLEAIGAAHAGAQRTVPGTPADLLRRLDGGLARSELLRIVRRTGDRLVFEPRRDMMGAVLQMQMVYTQGREFELARVDSLVASVTAVNDTNAVLRFDAVLEGARRGKRTTLFVVALLLWLLPLTAAVLVAGFSLALPGVGAAIVGALAVVAGSGTWLTWHAVVRRHRTMLARVSQRLDALLDEAEAGRIDAPVGLLGRLLGG